MLIAVKLLRYFLHFYSSAHFVIFAAGRGNMEEAGAGEADIVATLPPAIRRFDTPRFDIDTSG